MNLFRLTRVSHNAGFSRNQNGRYMGNRCILHLRSFERSMENSNLCSFINQLNHLCTFQIQIALWVRERILEFCHRMIKVKLIRFLPSLHRTEILTIFCSYFERNDDFINSFWNCLTFSMVWQKESLYMYAWNWSFRKCDSLRTKVRFPRFILPEQS